MALFILSYKKVSSNLSKQQNNENKFLPTSLTLSRQPAKQRWIDVEKNIEYEMSIQRRKFGRGDSESR